jgi:hypothetical protein
MKKKKKKKSRKYKIEEGQRDTFAIAAHFRNSAGPIIDEKKEADKKLCREEILDDEDYQ